MVLDMRTRTSSPSRAARAAAHPGAGEGGFSLIEVMIAGGIFLIIVIGLLPLFTRAMVDNTAGADYTTATNMARSASEQRSQLRLNDLALSAAAPDTFEYWIRTTKEWVADDDTPPAGAEWRRRVRVQQFSLNDLDDDGIFNAALDGSAPVEDVDIKEVEVRVDTVTPNGPFGGRRRTVIRTLKAY